VQVAARAAEWAAAGLVLSVWIRTAEPRCRLCIHIPHYPHPDPNPNLTLTLNLTLISSYFANKHKYAQPNMSAN